MQGQTLALKVKSLALALKAKSLSLKLRSLMVRTLTLAFKVKSLALYLSPCSRHHTHVYTTLVTTTLPAAVNSATVVRVRH